MTNYRKYFFVLIIIVLLVCGGVKVTNQKSKNKPYNNEVVQHVKSVYANGDGLIHAYPDKQHSRYLSESIGLYMNYLLTIESQQMFEQQYQNIKNHFRIQTDKGTFIKWIIFEDTTVNALIDDVRIVHTLKRAAITFNQPKYNQLANSMLQSIKKTQKVEGMYVDYYDWKQKQPAHRITLSYLTPAFFQTLNETRKMETLLSGVEQSVPFFPEYYDINLMEFKKNQEVHMIDQLLIALNRESLGIDSSAFHKWLIKEWNNKQKLFGRYNRNTLEPTVKYESLAVYSYLYEYFVTLDKEILSERVAERAAKVANDGDILQTHFFDYILYYTKIVEADGK